MLDDSDSSFAWLFLLFSNGWTAVFALVIAIVVAIIVAGNHAECAKMKCPDGQAPQLMNHACLCAAPAK